jgi:hypothetical protein
MNSVVFAKRKNISSKKKPITKMKITLSEELNRLTALLMVMTVNIFTSFVRAWYLCEFLSDIDV